MGYWLTKADTTPGKYTVEVNSKNPFCAGGTQNKLYIIMYNYTSLQLYISLNT